MPKIVYDLKNCEGYFVCVTSDPDNFVEGEVDGEDKAEVPGAKEVEPGLWVKEIPDDQVEQAMEAALGCPAEVIKVLDDDGNVMEGPETLPVEA